MFENENGRNKECSKCKFSNLFKVAGSVFCQRYPPQVFQTQTLISVPREKAGVALLVAWPKVEPTDLCGEYQPESGG